MDIPSSLIRIIVLFDEVFEYGDGEKSSGLEPLCVEFCNFVRCGIFVSY
jgi:hypothetical protein